MRDAWAKEQELQDRREKEKKEKRVKCTHKRSEMVNASNNMKMKI